MKRLLTISFAILVLTSISIAQDAPTLIGKGQGNMIPGPEVVLYEQMTLVGTNSLTSQNFGPANDAYDNQGADDFTVTAGEIWSIESVDVIGVYYNGTGPATSVNVFFYNNSGGFPGTLAAEVLNVVPSGGLADGSFSVTFASAVDLPEGDYWVSVQCNMEFAVGGQWGWTEHEQVGQESTWQNPGGGFATACNAWGLRVTTCAIGSAPYYDFAFRLNGTSAPVPVELTSFVATVNENSVILNWSTATEINNMGFEIQKSNGSEFHTVGYVEGNGTTTEAQNYSFTETDVQSGSYSYRLKQIDYDGTFEYSDAIEVDVLSPNVYSLSQNYPNPFNPNTMISFTLASDSKVSLTIFDVLGQEVTKLVNGNLAAGSHNYDFSASGLNSGVYFYRIDATGTDGTNFSSIMKMILAK